MQYMRYGKDGPEVSRLGFGAMRLPTRRPDQWDRVNYTRSVEVILASLRAGVNLIDTHHGYCNGNSEVAIGRALKGWKGHPVYIQTKTPWYQDKPRKHFEKLLYEAIEKMGVSCIDYYFFHAIRIASWKKKGRSSSGSRTGR